LTVRKWMRRYDALIISEAEDSGVLGEKKREVRGGMYKIGA